MSKVTVVGHASYPVCLDSGRHLQPGHPAEIEDSERHQQLIKDGQLRLVSQPVAANEPTPKSEPRVAAPVTAKPDHTQEA